MVPRGAPFRKGVVRATLTLDRGRRSIHPTQQESPRMTIPSDRRTELLAAAPLFADVDADGLARIADRAVEVAFTPGHVIARQGEIGTGFFLVADGRVRVVRDGQETASLGPGEFFGELSILDGKPRTAQVVAAEPTVCLALASWDFEAVVSEEPAVALAVLRALATRLRSLTESQHH
jgi:CRP/FNR family cyclic AMP-dependent transcriptional regulator